LGCGELLAADLVHGAKLADRPARRVKTAGWGNTPSTGGSIPTSPCSVNGD
jgi:hypothetical protein